MINAEGMCVLYDCVAKRVELSVLKWRWIPAKMKFDDVKLNCTAKKFGPLVPKIVPTVQLYCTIFSEGTIGGEITNPIG